MKKQKQAHNLPHQKRKLQKKNQGSKKRVSSKKGLPAAAADESKSEKGKKVIEAEGGEKLKELELQPAEEEEEEKKEEAAAEEQDV